jgi:ribonuclease HI
MAKFILYSDGGFQKTGVPTPRGSWSFVMHPEDGSEKFIHKFGLVDHHKQTSQTAEMMAIINALKFVEDKVCQGDIFLAQTIDLHIISDSQYCVNGATDWMHKWKKNNWEDKENIDLWKRIYSLTVNTFKSVQYEWVRGHDGNKFNELADLGCNIALGRITQEQAMKTWEKY